MELILATALGLEGVSACSFSFSFAKEALTTTSAMRQSDAANGEENETSRSDA